MLILLGLFPQVSGFVQHIPEPVLGGATLVMFGTIAASGVRIVSRTALNRRSIMIIALSLGIGLGVSQQPQIFSIYAGLGKIPIFIRDCSRGLNRDSTQFYLPRLREKLTDYSLQSILIIYRQQTSTKKAGFTDLLFSIKLRLTY